MILDYFSHAYLVNLDSRPDRLAVVTEDLGRVGIPFERFAARTSPDCRGQRSPGARGALLSLIGVLEAAQAASHESIILIEDDVVFRPEFRTEMEKIVPYLASLEWDIFTPFDWFNKATYSPDDLSLRRIRRNACTHFTAIHRRAYADLLAQLYSADIHQTGASADILFNGNPSKIMLCTTQNLVGQRVSETSATGTTLWDGPSELPADGIHWHAPAHWN